MDKLDGRVDEISVETVETLFVIIDVKEGVVPDFEAVGYKEAVVLGDVLVVVEVAIVSVVLVVVIVSLFDKEVIWLLDIFRVGWVSGEIDSRETEKGTAEEAYFNSFIGWA